MLMLFSASLLAASFAPCEMNDSDMPAMTDMNHSSNNQHECCDTSDSTQENSLYADCSMNMMQGAKIILTDGIVFTGQLLAQSKPPQPVLLKLLSANTTRLIRPPIA